MSKNRFRKIAGTRKIEKFQPLYIGRLSKKNQNFGFVDPITDEDRKRAKGFAELSAYLKSVSYSVQNIKGLDAGLFVSKKDMLTANDGDLVLVSKKKPRYVGESDEAVVKLVIDRKKDEIVGTVSIMKDFAFVVPDDKKFVSDIYIPKSEIFGASDGDKVLVKVVKYANKGIAGETRSSEGRIVKIVARAGDSHMKLKSILADHGIDEDFSGDVMREAENISEIITEKEKAGRVDLRGIYTITIDGEDAKDLDDAVAIEKKENYKVWISIADVSHYVKQGSLLDLEAQKRGNSIYLIDTVVPMLPFTLSNEMCSLNAGEDRLAMTVEAEIDGNGVVISSKVYKSIIKVDRRMSYKEVQGILDGNEEVLEKTKDIPEEQMNSFKLYDRLTKILQKRRVKNGYIGFDMPEVEILLDEKGKAIGVQNKKKLFSHKIIEHLMLTANEVVAEKFTKIHLPIMYRIHEYPDTERVADLNVVLEKFGIKINVFKREKKPGDENSENEFYVPQSEYIRVIAEIEAKKEEYEKEGKADTVDVGYLMYLLLRSMRQARYSMTNLGHFGLGSKFYSHFTSPIRRYSDLYTHRILTEYLETGKVSVKGINPEEIADHISSTERVAQSMEREYDKVKIAEYVETFVGNIFDGVVSGEINKGIFVDIGKEIEGLVTNEEIEKSKTRKPKEEYKVGDRVKVIVKNADLETGEIDFALI